MKRTIFGITVLLFTITLMNCGKKEDEAVAPKPSVTLTIDGTAKSVVAASAILAFETQNDHEGRSLNITSMEGNNPLSIAVSNWDFQNPPKDGIKLKTYDNLFADQGTTGAECLSLESGAVMLCDGGLVTYMKDNQVYMSALYDGAYKSFIKVTACDPSKKSISGEYDLKVMDGDSTELTLKGKFENIVYTVVH